ncbi:hypothetical protein ACFY1U_25250 [Streptomyces sp. NPDC001351]|uniref:hypothetical protein n=1 Tax=Streptomyces sp. NPDC001351 TaxID=3364564 RepID=UPI0036B8B38A
MIHLSSAFQPAGCPHVVSTLRPVRDSAAVTVAAGTYPPHLPALPGNRAGPRGARRGPPTARRVPRRQCRAVGRSPPSGP